MKKKLIHVTEENHLQCDNKLCDYVLKVKDPKRSGESYIDEPCPKCGENLLTENDYQLYLRTMKIIDWINKWFSWLGTYPNDERNKEIGVSFHEEIKIHK